MQKTARKNTKYYRNETTLKFGHLAKAIAFAWAITFAKYSILGKNLNCLKHVKIDVQGYWKYSVQKTARKYTKYSKNETILKVGPVAKAIAFA